MSIPRDHAIPVTNDQCVFCRNLLVDISLVREKLRVSPLKVEDRMSDTWTVVKAGHYVEDLGATLKFYGGFLLTCPNGHELHYYASPPALASLGSHLPCQECPVDAFKQMPHYKLPTNMPVPPNATVIKRGS